MKAKFVISAVCAATVLSGCYVIPIDYPHAPATGQMIVPATQPLPITLQARLYPLNETAGKMGALTATVVDSANGHGTFSLNYAGEVLQGEASRVAAGKRGVASAAGARGTYVNCEYALNGPNRGTGACLFSNGAKYQLHFGG